MATLVCEAAEGALSVTDLRDSDLRLSDLGLDSIGFVRVIDAVDAEFDIEIDLIRSPHALHSLRTLAGYVSAAPAKAVTGSSSSTPGTPTATPPTSDCDDDHLTRLPGDTGVRGDSRNPG